MLFTELTLNLENLAMNELLQLAMFWLSLLIRLAHSSLGNSKPKQYWQYLTMSILFVLNNFINSLLIVKSNEFNWDLFK